jgi:hypothetical protein
MDAVRIGDRVYHASCHAEATAGVAAGVRGGTPGARATPDRVLGKRKAEVCLLSTNAYSRGCYVINADDERLCRMAWRHRYESRRRRKDCRRRSPLLTSVDMPALVAGFSTDGG